MPVILYGTEFSPPVRAVKMVAKAIGLEYEWREVNLAALDHMKPEYVKMNPIHSVPTLVDGDFVIFDSHAIAAYLVGKYAKDDSWYPKDLQKRAVVDQRLHFDTGILFHRARNVTEPVMFRNQPLDPQRVQTLRDAIPMFDALLGENEYIAGPKPTIADICCAATISSIFALLPDAATPRTAAWLKRCEDNLPGYKELNTPGVEKIGAMFRSKLSQ